MAAATRDQRYAFPLCLQIAPPASPGDAGFAALLDILERLGFHGVEVNLTDFDRFPPEAWLEPLSRRGLKFTMIATGACANLKGLSLSSPDPAIREKTLREMEKCLSFASRLGAGIICGFIKGPAGLERGAALGRLRDSLSRLDPLARQYRTPLLLEATNHYEASLALTLDEAAEIIGVFGNPDFRVLPDTYHMNIEEAAPLAALTRHAGKCVSVHVSDNNRLFPGLGALDFYRVLATLRAAGFSGTMAIEGRNRGRLADEIEFSAKHLEGASSRLAFLEWAPG
ncbi:MAG: sugar phosphate isomerase/epimerase [Planctomycetota bacterium]|jgi:sugar phosphate isomerase/epimerase|nr:sugar phosphate isomerase/epimerase [Planctomycetota bacterium]